MKIRTQQHLVMAVSAAALALLALNFYALQREATDAIEFSQITNDMLSGVTELRFVTVEYILHQHGRPKEQWFRKHRSMTQLFTRGRQGDPAIRETVNALARQHENLKLIFTTLIEYAPLAGLSPEETGLREEARGLLVSQILETTQSMIAGALLMARDSDARMSATQRTTSTFAILVIAVLGLLIVVNVVLVSRGILAPLMRFQDGTRIVAEGNLEHRLGIGTRDEIGGLAASFDRMTGKLSDSRALLEAEIAQRRRAETELAQTAAELRRSNTELGQFAYITSHDLQEPLRMVVSYLQLLERRYKGRLDQDADEFIGYAVDGAIRMRRLINDVLDYSRVGTRAKPFEPVDSAQIVRTVIASLKSPIDEGGARIECGPLPTIVADPTQLSQVFQNLLANAIKFWRDRVPQIGIAPEHINRLFGVFQRLHTRREYPGTGIGLAICKKIVEHHGGRIWVESEPGKGSTFQFTIPDRERSAA